MIIRIILGVLIVAAAGLYSLIEDDLYQLFNITGWIGLGLCGFAGMMSDGFRQPEYNRSTAPVKAQASSLRYGC